MSSMAEAKPDTAERVCEMMIHAGKDAPGYIEPDGTTYRVIVFQPRFRKRYVGAVAEWRPGSDDAEVTLFKTAEAFESVFANITLCADRVL